VGPDRFEAVMSDLLRRIEEAEGRARALEERLADPDLASRQGEFAEAAKELGRSALGGLERAADAAKRCLAALQNRFEEANTETSTVVAKGKAVVRRATIEAKALRHGVRVGLRVARRVSRRTKTAKG